MEKLKKAPLKVKRLPRGVSLDIYSYLPTHEILFKIGLLSKKDRESCVNSHMLGERIFCFNMLQTDLGKTRVIPQFAIDVCKSLTLKYMLTKENIENPDSYKTDKLKETIDIQLEILAKHIF